jgi:argininosuccinate lyase
MKLWQKQRKLDPRIEEFTVGRDPELDLELIPYDCAASMAHARMLKSVGILRAGEARALVQELGRIIELWKKGKFRIRPSEEDSHTAIENHLTRKLGAAGKKIHTGRSRNDQVLTALRLYSRDKIIETQAAVAALVQRLSGLSRKHVKIVLPGYTHSRKAMPYTVGKYFRAFADALQDDLVLLRTAAEINDQNPLGTAAGYGTTLEIDRDLTTRLLGFRRTQRSELYAQNSRGKFESIILSALSQVMLDLQRLAHDLVLYSMDEFGYFRLPEEFCTGSSIMPQKKNPDVLELVRANFAVVHAGYLQTMEILKGLPSGYHRDLQLTKEPLLRGFRETLESVRIMDLILSRLGVEAEKCRAACTDEIFAADRAIEVARTGVPFRDAYHKISKKY